MFNLELVDRFPLTRETVDGNRHYVTPKGTFPSVTTILKYYGDKSFLEKWKKRKGEVESSKILVQAGNRGSSIHSVCEKFLLNHDDYDKKVMPGTMIDFENLRPFLEKNIASVLGVELPLYSCPLRAAGTADLFCVWGNEPTIVDFKTSRSTKKEEWIESYFIQASTYAVMAKELYSIDVPNIVIIMMTQNEYPKIYRKNTADYLEKVYEAFIHNRPTCI